jgi:hypothetical protein
VYVAVREGISYLENQRKNKTRPTRRLTFVRIPRNVSYVGQINNPTKENEMANNAETTEVVEIKPQNKKVRQALADFIQAKADEKSAKERKATAEAILREALGTATVATVNGTKAFSLVSSKNSSFDGKMLQEKFPVAYAETLRVTPYDYIRTA